MHLQHYNVEENVALYHIYIYITIRGIFLLYDELFKKQYLFQNVSLDLLY